MSELFRKLFRLRSVDSLNNKILPSRAQRVAKLLNNYNFWCGTSSNYRFDYTIKYIIDRKLSDIPEGMITVHTYR